MHVYSTYKIPWILTVLGLKIVAHVKGASFGLPLNIHTCLSLVNSIDLDIAWVKDSRPFISFVYSRDFARLAIQHTGVFYVGIPNCAFKAP